MGSKPLFFEELKPHGVRVELRCSKGYMIRGPNKLLCHYGEWNVDDTPECVPGTMISEYFLASLFHMHICILRRCIYILLHLYHFKLCANFRFWKEVCT